MRLKLSPQKFLKLLSTSLLYTGSKGIFAEMLLRLTPEGMDCSGNYLGSVLNRAAFYKSYFDVYEPEDTTEFLASTLLFEQLKSKFSGEDLIEITTRDDYIVVEGANEVFRIPMSKPGFTLDPGIPFGLDSSGALVGFLPLGMVPKVQFLIPASNLRMGGTRLTFSCKPESITLISIDEKVQSEWRKTIISKPEDLTKSSSIDIAFQAEYLDSLTAMFEGACWVSIDDTAVVLSFADNTMAKSFAQARLLD